GVDEYLRLAAQAAAHRAAEPATSTAEPQAMSGAELRATEKEIAAIDRRLARLADQIATKHRELAEHDQADHIGITRLTEQLRELEGGVAELENRWLELAEVVD
ncbi:MAG: transport system ATP-binding/permease protein, partial [Mycobacterium sp.]|nr:transport system ATP-binding/permease protein [Mycobacterium sp.]